MASESSINCSRPLTHSEREQWAAQMLDPTKVLLFCGKHNYAASGKQPPTMGCAECWHVFYTVLFAELPPSRREEVMVNLEEAVRKMTELIEKGRWGFKPYRHPILTIQKGKD